MEMAIKRSKTPVYGSDDVRRHYMSISQIDSLQADIEGLTSYIHQDAAILKLANAVLLILDHIKHAPRSRD